MTKLGPLPDWHNLPILSSARETEFIALPWKCEYCGLIHPGERLKCWDGVNGCGAPKPGCDEPPRTILELCPRAHEYLTEIEQELSSEPHPFYSYYDPPSFEDFKLDVDRTITARKPVRAHSTDIDRQ